MLALLNYVKLSKENILKLGKYKTNWVEYSKPYTTIKVRQMPVLHVWNKIFSSDGNPFTLSIILKSNILGQSICAQDSFIITVEPP